MNKKQSRRKRSSTRRRASQATRRRASQSTRRKNTTRRRVSRKGRMNKPVPREPVPRVTIHGKTIHGETVPHGIEKHLSRVVYSEMFDEDGRATSRPEPKRSASGPSDEGGALKKVKKTAYQTARLKEEYDKGLPDKYGPKAKEISDELGLSWEKVKKWIDNRRQQDKR